MLPIDRVVCLSLVRRQDRRDIILQDWKKQVALKSVPDISFEFYDAEPQETKLVPASWRDTRGYFAATEDHKRILELLWQDKSWKNALILEDDAKFTNAFATTIDDAWSELNEYAPDWLGFFLGGAYRHSPTKVSPNVWLNHGSLQCHAYVINRPGLWRIYDHLWCSPHKIVDWAYMHLMEQDKCCYSVNPWLITTTGGFSDNLQRSVGEGS